MTTIRAHAATPSASRYLQQLAKHWAHKMPVTFDPGQAAISFPDGASLTLTAEPERLSYTLDVPDGQDAERMNAVVTSHLDRFAFREAPLPFVRE